MEISKLHPFICPHCGDMSLKIRIEN
jgi:hypothetical protein